MIREGRYAAIDIGTVTCRMLVVDVRERPDGSIDLDQLTKEYAVTNLGEGVDKSRMLKPEALQRVATAIDGFLDELEKLNTPEHPVVQTLVMATSASRDAKNADEFVALLEARGLNLHVISGDTEALMSFIGASSAHSGESVMVVDVGGGSTEVSVGVAGSNPVASHSFDVGCRRVTERFWDGYPPSPEAVARARKWIREQLDGYAELWLYGASIGRERECPEARFCRTRNPWDNNPHGFRSPKPRAKGISPHAPKDIDREFLIDGGRDQKVRMLAVAGTATSAVSIREKMETYDSDRVNGSVVTLSQLEAIEADLASKTLEGLQHVVGLDPRRGPVIVAGMIILEEVMRVASVDSFIATESDILEGMIMYNAGAGHTGKSQCDLQ